MSRFNKNSAFFKGNTGNDILGGEPAEAKTDMGGSISAKGLVNAFKRAKQSGAFIVQNAGISEFPVELCDFAKY